LRNVFEICRRIRKKIESQREHEAPRRFILLPIAYRSELKAGAGSGISERDLKAEAAESAYFLELDILVVRYDKRDEKYSGLEEILDEWCELPPVEIKSGFEGANLE